MTGNPGRSERSGCPITNALELFGDRWTLVIIRDLAVGKRHYGEFLDSPEGISTNILAQRLKFLKSVGIVDQKPFREPIRYEYALTKKGRELLPILQAICRWANRHIPNTWRPPANFMAAGPSALPVKVD